jgi:hypothetical protein
MLHHTPAAATPAPHHPARRAAAGRSTRPGIKGYITNLTGTSAEFVIGAYHRLFQIEASFRMSKHDLAARPIYHQQTRVHLSTAYPQPWRASLQHGQLLAQDEDPDLIGSVGSGAQHHPAQKLGEHQIDRPERHPWNCAPVRADDDSAGQRL